MRTFGSHLVIATLALSLLCACGATTQRAAQASPSATTSAVVSPVTSSPSPSEPPAIVSAAVSGDRFTLTFSAGSHPFTIQHFPTADFNRDASGLPVHLAGAAGIRIAMTGFRGDMDNYTGPQILDSSGPLVLQVAAIGDYEGYVSFGIGLAKPACVNATKTGSILVFDFVQAPKSGCASSL